MKQKGFSTILVFLIVAIVGAAAYFFINPDQSKLSIPTSTPPAQIASPMPHTNNYKSEHIEFTYPVTLEVKEEIDPDLGSKFNVLIFLAEKNKMSYSLEIGLKLDGLGGGCPPSTEGYEIESIDLDGKTVYKAKFVDKDDPEKAHMLGRVYFEDNIKDGEFCPSAFTTNKNQASRIEYDLTKLPLNSEEYLKAEEELDSVVSSIKGFWE